ncbi:MAG TPA: response regulator [Alphaproteobacteria bacterium]|nr:response regulator [Alphaproteobacteria bacterium]
MAKILVVDDEPFMRMTLVDMIEEAGHEVCAVESANEARAYLRQHPDTDLTLTDYNMRGETGASLIRTSREEFRNVQFMILTGSADEPELHGLGVPILHKPIGYVALTDAIATKLASVAHIACGD